MSEFKVVARCESVLEADALKTILESEDIRTFVESEHMGTILPHATQALGGIRLKVLAADEERALALLAEISSNIQPKFEDAEDGDQPKDHRWGAVPLIKRATYGAVIGSVILPIISNFFSMWLYWRAYRIDPGSLKALKGRVIFGMLVNIGTVIGMSWYFVSAFSR